MPTENGAVGIHYGVCVPINCRGHGSCATVGSMQSDISLIPTATTTPPVTVAQGFPERFAVFTSEVHKFYFKICWDNVNISEVYPNCSQ